MKIENSWATDKNYYKKTWLELRDGGSGQWMYAVSHGLCFVFIVIDDLVDVGARELGLFCASVRVVDLSKMSHKTIADVLKSCGIEFNTIADIPEPLEIAECCMDYGAAANLWEECGGKVTESFMYGGADEKHPAFRKLRSDARKYAEENCFDYDSLVELMDNTVVNAIGSTATEYMCGDIWTALGRAKDNPEATEEQKLIMKIYGNAERTLGGEKIPEFLKE